MGFMCPLRLFDAVQSTTFPRYHPRYTLKTFGHIANTTNTNPLYLSKQPHNHSGATHFSVSSYISWASKIWISTVPFSLYILFLLCYSHWLLWSYFSTRCFVFKKVHHRWGTDLSTGAGYSLCFIGGKTSAQCIGTLQHSYCLVCCQHFHL